MKPFILIIIFTFFYVELKAQNGISFFGNTKIHGNSEMYVNNYPIYNEGITQTERENLIGTISILNVENGTENPIGFIDGYVRVYNSGEYIFQIGNENVYAPIEINFQNDELTNVAYNRNSFNPTEVDATLEILSSIEHWDILGQNDGNITMIWSNQSNLSDFINELSELTIAGWNGSKWSAINSTIEISSDLNSGKISTTEAIDFSVYSAFTFAKSAELNVSDFNIYDLKIALQNNQFILRSSESILKSQIFDIQGRFLKEFKINENQNFQSEFNYPKGIYITKLILKNGKIITKKLMHQ